MFGGSAFRVIARSTGKSLSPRRQRQRESFDGRVAARRVPCAREHGEAPNPWQTDSPSSLPLGRPGGARCVVVPPRHGARVVRVPRRPQGPAGFVVTVSPSNERGTTARNAGAGVRLVDTHGTARSRLGGPICSQGRTPDATGVTAGKTALFCMRSTQDERRSIRGETG